jgi:hypothetical protein
LVLPFPLKANSPPLGQPSKNNKESINQGRDNSLPFLLRASISLPLSSTTSFNSFAFSMEMFTSFNVIESQYPFRQISSMQIGWQSYYKGLIESFILRKEGGKPGYKKA